MKTLKQQLQEKGDFQNEAFPLITLEEITQAVKEWLTQKQQTPPKYIDQLYYTMTIDELLEELNQ